MPNTIQTREIESVLEEFASKNEIARNECDFILHKVTTYFKDTSMDSYVQYTKAYAERYSRSTLLIDDRVSFRQFYTVTPIKTSTCDIALDYELEVDSYYTHPYLSIRPSSHIDFRRYDPKGLFKILHVEINKIKAREKMLVGIRSDPMITDIKAFIRLLYTGTFSKAASIRLFDGIRPEIARPGRLISHYEKKNRGRRLKEVEAGELIIEYVKPVFGSDGLNALGQRVSKNAVTNEQFITTKIDSATIERKEDNEHIRLYSKRRGFVDVDEHLMKISNIVRLNSVKRVESQITDQEQNEVEIVIEQKDISQDTVGEGVKLVSETIHVSGYVADKAELQAKHLIIDGVTHQGSNLFAKDATINRHKGMLRCQHAEIKLLEGGEVHASEVHIKTALGGKVYADKIAFGEVRHHLKAYAAHEIIVEKVRGEENLFMIETKKNPIVQGRLDYMYRRLEAFRDELDDAKKHHEDDIPAVMEKINTLKEEIQAVPNSVLEAKIVFKGRIDGYNTIAFILPDGQQITHHTTERMRYAPFYLESDDKKVTLHPVGTTIRSDR